MISIGLFAFRMLLEVLEYCKEFSEKIRNNEIEKKSTLLYRVSELTWAHSRRGVLSHLVTGLPFLTVTLWMWHLLTLMRRQDDLESVRQLSTLSVLQTGLSSVTVAVSLTVEQVERNLTEHLVVRPPSQPGLVMFRHWRILASISLSSSEISQTFSRARVQAEHSS